MERMIHRIAGVILLVSLSLFSCSEYNPEDAGEEGPTPYERGDTGYIYTISGMANVLYDSGEGNYLWQGNEEMTVTDGTTGVSLCTVRWRTTGDPLPGEEYCSSCSLAYEITGNYENDDCGWGGGTSWEFDYGVYEISETGISILYRIGNVWIELGTGRIQEIEDGWSLTYQSPGSPYSGM